MTPETLIAAGGIAPATAALDHGDALDAVAFAHPALPGRVVVRLAPATVAPGLVSEMELVGFAERGRTAAVGRVRRRTLGFPAQALVSDPKNARYALEVMKGFSTARKRIATKPGHARDAFAELAERLGRAAPHFLPSFWEEAGRAFIHGGAIAMATTAFEKARQAEREHGLLVDEDARAGAFIEFALAGALAVKSILAWPQELKRTAGPEVAFDRFFDLAVRRTLGGRSPWASLPKDLRELARAAKRDPAAEEARFLRAVLGAVALRRAPVGFWKEVAASVGEAAREPATARALARLFPEYGDDDHLAQWIGLLERWGVIDRLAAEGLDGGLAAWTGKALAAWDDAHAALLGVVKRLIPRLLAEGRPVPVMGEDVWRVEAVDVFEELVAAGVPLQVEGDGSPFRLGRWAAEEGPRRDPVHLAAHPVLGKVLRDSARDALDEDAFQRVAPGMTAFREVRRAALAEAIAAFGKGGLVALDTALEEVEGKVPASTLAEFPEEAAPVPGLDVAGALARTLAGGVFDELGWPAFEEAHAELSQGKDAEVTAHALAPFLVLHEGRRAIVLGPEGRLGRFDLKLPKGADPAGFRWADGQLLTAWRDPADWSTMKGAWSGRPKEILTLEWEGGEDVPTPTRDGVTLCGGRPIRAGDTAISDEPTWCDAEGVWTRRDGELRAVVAGALGPADAPAFLAPRDAVTPDLDATDYAPQPVAGSPLGGDPYGWTVFALHEVEDPETWIARHAPRALRLPIPEDETPHVGFARDGRAVVTPEVPRALVRWPGSDAPRVVMDHGWRDVALVGPDGAVLATLEDGEDGFRAGSDALLPLSLWHHLVPRDPAGSAALRAMDEATAAKLLALAEGLEEGDVAGLAARVPDALPITHPALAKGVAGIVLHARALRRRLVEWRAEAAAPVPVEGPTDGELRAALSGLLDGWGDDDTSVIAAIRAVSAFLDGEERTIPDSDLAWTDWLDHAGALVFARLSPATSPEERAHIDALLDALAASRFAGSAPTRHMKLTAPKTAPWLEWETEWGDRTVAARWTRVEGDHRWWFFAAEETDDDRVTMQALEAAPFAIPEGATLVGERPYRVDVELLGRHRDVTLPVGDEVYAAIGGPSGLSRAESAAVWAALRELSSWGNDPLGKRAREVLGLKLGDAKTARDTLGGTSIGKRWQVFQRAIAGWDGDPATLPARVGEAWAANFGTRVRLDEALLKQARVDLPGGEPADALGEIAAVTSTPVLQRDGAWSMDEGGCVVTEDEGVFDVAALVRVVGAILWVYGNTPGEDPLRANLPGVLDAVRARLANPKLLLQVASDGGKPLLGWFKRFDGAPFVPGKVDPEVPEKDRPRGKARDGVVAVLADEWLHVAVRPAELTPAGREELDRVVKLAEDEDATLWALGMVASPEMAACVADRSPGWPQDPRRSAPEVVAEAQAKHGLDADAAVLWLQLLALPNPTRANVLSWNGWKPAAHAKAAAALVEKGLVLEAKRARAGRDHFLPGGWHERRSGSLPMEEWKLRWYGGAEPPLGEHVPLQPFSATFRAAWARVRAGDVPRYEKTR